MTKNDGKVNQLNNVLAEMKTQTDRILSLMDEADTIKLDLKECYDSLKKMGVDIGAARAAIKLLRKGAEEKAKFDEKVALTEMYYDSILKAAEKEVL